MQLIDGKAVAAEIKKEIAKEVEEIVKAGGKPHSPQAFTLWATYVSLPPSCPTRIAAR